MQPRVMVSPSMFALTDALSQATGFPRAECQQLLADPLRDADGTYGPLAWWTAPDGKRHFRLGKEDVLADAPAVARLYPDRCFWRMHGERFWEMACPCGAVVPIERWTGKHCDAAPPAWDSSPFSVHQSGNRLIVLHGDEVLLDRAEGDPPKVTCLAADGSAFAAATTRDLSVWRLDEGKLRLAQVFDMGGVRAMLFRRDGSLIAANMNNVRSFGPVGELHRLVYFTTRAVVALGLSPLERTLHAATADACMMRLEREGHDWRLVRGITMPALKRAWFSPCGRWLAWANENFGVGLFDLTEQRDHGKAGPAFRLVIEDVRFIDGGLVVRHGGATSLLPWNSFSAPIQAVSWPMASPSPPPPPPPPSIPAYVPPPPPPMEAVDWEVRFRVAALSGLPERLAMWVAMPIRSVEASVETTKAEALRRLIPDPERVTALAVSPDAVRIAWADGERVRLSHWLGETLWEFPLGKSGVEVESLAFSPDGQRLAFIGRDRPIVYDLKRKKEMEGGALMADRVPSLAFGHDSKTLHTVECATGGAVLCEWAFLGASWRAARTTTCPVVNKGWIASGASWRAWATDDALSVEGGGQSWKLAGLGAAQDVRFVDDSHLVALIEGEARLIPWRTGRMQ